MYELSQHKGEDFRIRSRYTISFICYIIHTILLVEANSGILSAYNAQMRALNAAFKADKAAKSSAIEPTTAYLFLVNQSDDKDCD